MSGDWRDTFWGHMIPVGIVLASASATVGIDSEYRVSVRVIALAIFFFAIGLLLYALLRVLKVVPVVRGLRRKQLNHVALQDHDQTKDQGLSEGRGVNVHTSMVKVVPFAVVFGGWKGRLSIEGDKIRIERAEAIDELLLDLSEVKRASFNSSNGLWSFRLNNGQRLRFQSAGSLLSADRSDAGRATNEMIHEQLAARRVPGLSM